MDKGLLVVCSIYLLVFLLSSGVPLYLFLKTRLLGELCALFSAVLSVISINLFFFIGKTLNLPYSPLLRYTYELFWLVPPIFVYCYCLVIRRKKDKKK